MEQYCTTIDKATYILNVREILDVFERIKKGELKNDTYLLNYYKGVPVSYEASIVDIDRGKETVFFNVHRNQLVVMGMEKRTLIRSSHFRRDLVADINYVRHKKREVALMNFIYVDILSGKRNFVRVEVDETVEMKVSFDNRVAIGRCIDLSLKSIAAFIDGGGDLLTAAPDLVRISANLTAGSFVPQQVEVDAKVYKISEENGRWKVIFELFPNKKTELLISQYLVQKQIELVRELKELSWND